MSELRANHTPIEITDKAKEATNGQTGADGTGAANDSEANDDDSDFVLQRHQVELLDECRQSFLSCNTSAERFEVCAEYRDHVLAKSTEAQLLAAKIEVIMLDECEEYKQRKLSGWSKETEELEASSWKRFVCIVQEGKQTIGDCPRP